VLDNAASFPDDIESLRRLVAAQRSELDAERAARVAAEGNWCRRNGIVWLAPLPFSSKDILGARSTKPAHPA
jgi:hypothetical protein